MTAVEWLKNELNERCDIIGNESSITNIFDKAKEMEADQIMIAFEDGSEDGSEAMIGISNGYINSEDYYNKIYKKCKN
jgi:hypothetical protein